MTFYGAIPLNTLSLLCPYSISLGLLSMTWVEQNTEAKNYDQAL